MKTIYHQKDSRIFSGFYESNLFNSDSLYDFNQELPDNFEFDIDFDDFKREVSRKL